MAVVESVWWGIAVAVWCRLETRTDRRRLQATLEVQVTPGRQHIAKVCRDTRSVAGGSLLAWNRRWARVALGLATAVTVVTVARVATDTSDRAADQAIVPTAVGVLLIVRGSVFSWQRLASRPRGFVVDDGRAFLLLPDRAVMKVTGYVLGSAFPLGLVVTGARGSLDGLGWLALATSIAAVPTALLHALFLWRGTPRPLLDVTPEGVTSRGVLGSWHAPWDAVESAYASWPTMDLWFRLPVFDRSALRRRGLHLLGVQPPRPGGNPLRLRAAWATNPWWAAQALAYYWRDPSVRGWIGRQGEHDLLVGLLRIHDHEIEDQLDRFRRPR